jgi:hypothetical protein
MPLQLFFAPLHSDVPLQEFTPAQCMVASSAATAVLVIAEENNIAAAAAKAAPDILFICIFHSSFVMSSNIAARIQDPANGVIITQLTKLMLVSIGGVGGFWHADRKRLIFRILMPITASKACS